MRVLILGGGGREHALAWKIAQSPVCSALFCGPGNPGTAALATNVPLRADDRAEVARAVAQLRIDLVVVGPEGPLVNGVADEVASLGVAVFGPTAGAAHIEGSKAFAKEVMRSAGIPTAGFRAFDSPAEAEAYVRAQGRAVVKADGLAAGKGVVVVTRPEDAAEAVRSLASLGAASRTLVVEEFLEGEEVSVIALCDAERYALLPPARDHKRVGDGDTGPNTGGMGAYTPAILNGEQLAEIGRTVIAPTLADLRRRGLPFRGALYAGLMLTRTGPKVLEFNCRFGDPETQVLMLQVEEDLLPLLDACARGRLSGGAVKSRAGVSVGVVMAAAGYPQTPRLGDPISGLHSGGEAVIFHAGTRAEGDRVVTSGGRVLTVCATGPSVAQARAQAYAAVGRVSFPGMLFRRDIAQPRASISASDTSG